jgi:hypothetical protein
MVVVMYSSGWMVEVGISSIKSIVSKSSIDIKSISSMDAAGDDDESSRLGLA